MYIKRSHQKETCKDAGLFFALRFCQPSEDLVLENLKRDK
jgi:hypothetical protein